MLLGPAPTAIMFRSGDLLLYRNTYRQSHLWLGGHT